MTTKVYLSQIERLEKMIQNKLTEIYQLKTMACSAAVSNEDERVQNSVDKDRLGTLVTKIVQMEKEVDHMVDKRVHIVSQIDQMEDTDSYDVLAKKYILGKGEKVIAVERRNSERHIRRLFERAHDEFERNYGKEYL